MNFFIRYLKEIRRIPEGEGNVISLIKNYYSWKNSNQINKTPLNDGIPWMTFDAIRFLKRNLNKNMRIFEYGSGGSSIFFCGRSSEVISVEHDKEWFSLVKNKIDSRQINNWKGALIEPERSMLANLNPSDPDLYSSSSKETENCSFEKYVRYIDQFPDDYFDVVVIDGRSRPSCIKHSIAKVRKNGYLLLDNADREEYKPAQKKYLESGFSLKVNNFGPTSHNPEFTLTRIWRKI